MSRSFSASLVLLASASFLVAGCDLVNPALPCRSDADCGAEEICSTEGRCTSGDARPDGGDLREPDGPAPEDGGVEPDVGPGEPDVVEPDVPTDGGEPDAPPSDAGEPDAPPNDGGEPDAPPNDGGEPDASPIDAGEPDAPPVDAGEPDAPPVDAGEPDAPPVDAGEPDVIPDAGADAGPPDAGFVDAGFPLGTLADALGFNLSSADVSAIVVPEDPVAFNLGGCTADTLTFDSTDQTFSPSNCSLTAAQIAVVPSSNALDQAVVVIHGASVRVPSNKTFRLIGDKPVVIASLDFFELDGVIDASGDSERTGDETFIMEPGAGGDVHDRCGQANGGDAGETGQNEGHGGGGAGHVTRGGLGGVSEKNGIAGGPGTMGGLITIGGLVAGCRGGDGSGDQGGGGLKRGQGGVGGGAVHIAAATEIRGSGVVTVAGAGGVRSAEKKVGGGGGGSGGTIILTPGEHLNLAGAKMLATGGGGGSGEEDTKLHSSSGRKGTADAPVPLGGGLMEPSSQREAGRGGIGGTNRGPEGGENGRLDKTGGGGGGGSAGRIFIEFSGQGTCNLPRFSYPPPTNTGNCATQAVCGDGETTGNEECDDGNYNLRGDVLGCGCSPTCQWLECQEPGSGGVSFRRCEASENCPETITNGSLVYYCESGSTCSIDYVGTGTCDVICESGATCSLDATSANAEANLLCAPGAICDIDACSGAQRCNVYSTDDPPGANRFDPD